MRQPRGDEVGEPDQARSRRGSSRRVAEAKTETPTAELLAGERIPTRRGGRAPSGNSAARKGPAGRRAPMQVPSRVSLGAEEPPHPAVGMGRALGPLLLPHPALVQAHGQPLNRRGHFAQHIKRKGPEGSAAGGSSVPMSPSDWSERVFGGKATETACLRPSGILQTILTPRTRAVWVQASLGVCSSHQSLDARRRGADAASFGRK